MMKKGVKAINENQKSPELKFASHTEILKKF